MGAEGQVEAKMAVGRELSGRLKLKAVLSEHVGEL